MINFIASSPTTHSLLSSSRPTLSSLIFGVITHYDHRQLMFVFLPGSLIGLVVQPILGILSDNHESRYGRRRPFIFAGALLLALAYSLLANAYSIGNAFGDEAAAPRPTDIRPVGASVAIVSFWVRHGTSPFFIFCLVRPQIVGCCSPPTSFSSLRPPL